MGGVVVWIVGDQVINGSESGTAMKQALRFMSAGFRLHDTMIYKKKNYAPQNHNRYEQAWEYMFVFSKGRPKTFNPIMVQCKEAGAKRNWERKGSNVSEGVFRRRNEVVETKPFKMQCNVWEYSCGTSQTGHPAPFPEQLATDHILSWSNEGDLVCDIFSGSATTAKMAIQYNRQFVGSEISEEYWRLGNARIQPLLIQTKLQFN